MTSGKVMRWMMAFGTGVALLVGSAAAQETATSNKSQQQAPAVSKPEQTVPAAKPVGEVPAAKPKPEAAALAKSQPEEPKIQNRKDKISYAFGVDMARDLQRQKDSLNIDLLIRALADAMAGKTLIMTDEEVAATVKTFEAEQKQDLRHATMMVSEQNRRDGEAFFAENAKKEGVITMPSGLQYKILKKGDGKIPTLDDVVVCNYTGKLLDGTEIDSSHKRKEPTLVPVKGVMAGWTQALQLMPVGSKWELYIPPQLGYGDKASALFGPNASLIFEVELVSIQVKPQSASAAK
jgi:FKBP-type peptidyl-prolyl cis-trans isomerase FklB